jgi:RimJ/RimL family protein N-acetyltransferase
MSVRPHEIPSPGPAADFAATLQAMLPVLSTERLTLRAPRLEDFETYAEISDGPRGRFLIDAPSREAAWFDFVQVTATWLLRGYGAWTIEDTASSEVLGFVLLGFEPGDNEPELGYLLRESAEGRGIASEAARAIRAHAFGPLNMPTLISTVDHANTRSAALAERLGGVRDPKSEAAYNGEIRVYRYATEDGARR